MKSNNESISMNKNSIHIITIRISIFILLFIVEFTTHLLYAENKSNVTKDSILFKISGTKNEAKQIELYQTLAKLTRQTPEEAAYLKKVIEIAQENDSIHQVYISLTSLARYYCNTGQFDSLYYYSKMVDSIAQKRKEIPDAVFDCHNFVCRSYILKQEYELAMDEAIRSQNLANKVQNRLGKICSNENLGIIYFYTGRNKEAATAFEEALLLLKEEKDQYQYQYQINEVLLQTYSRLHDLDKMEKLLIETEVLLNVIDKWCQTNNIYFPTKGPRLGISSHFLSLYVNQKDDNKIPDALKKVEFYKDENFDNDVKSIYSSSMAKYYFYKKKYPTALIHINNTLKFDYSENTLRLKIEILKAAGKKEDALAVYEELLEYISRMNTTAFTRQLNQLKTLHDQNNADIQNRELTYQKSQTVQKQKQLVISLSFSAVLLVIFIILFRYYYHARKLKNELEKEKHTLIESEHNLRIAKDQAEEASNMKSAFIANISHEIRTPLNAIVGFAELLGDADENEKQNFIDIISANSDSLLTIVNDVLDLSIFEMQASKPNLQKCLVQYCCQYALDQIKHRTAPDVKLTFTHPDEPFTMLTDPLRLQQLLGNLLTNAAKFTTEGEINLNFDIDKKNRQVIFTITDTGCGIPPEKQQLIFNPFSKVDDFKQGAGLGLSICRKIAKLLDGNIMIDTTYTKGARFIFIHPIFET